MIIPLILPPSTNTFTLSRRKNCILGSELTEDGNRYEMVVILTLKDKPHIQERCFVCPSRTKNYDYPDQISLLLS